jgi:alpha-galactosidase
VVADVLDNAEVIDVDQDALGRQAKVQRRNAQEMVMVKPMQDGSVAIGLFNLGTEAHAIAVSWKDAGMSGKLKVRDVWRKKDVGRSRDGFTAMVGPHDVELIRVRR